MVPALAVCTIILLALLVQVAAPTARRWLAGRRSGRRRRIAATLSYDPGRERRAEQRARVLLDSCLNAEERAMYRDLGFIRVWGRRAHGPGDAGPGAPYAYVIYPHKPIVAYVPQTGRLLSEYCVDFPDMERPFGSARLPASDDVLAKWMALTGDERRLLASANMHLPGRQVDPAAVRRDLWRLSRWEQARLRAATADSADAAGRRR
jgi:hypothetical protein